MTLLFGILSAVVALFLGWQDYKTRLVCVYLLIVLFVFSLISGFCFVPFKNLATNLFINLLFLALILLVLSVYTRVRFSGKVSFFKEAFALGDVGFLIAVAPMFSFNGFALFFTIAAFLAIVITFFLVDRNKLEEVKIPFVSYMSFVYVILLVSDKLFSENFCFFTTRIFIF